MSATEINLVNSGTVLWTASAPYPDPSNPQLTIRDVSAAATGAGINWRGAWNSGTNYFAQDAVLGPDSNPYICILANTNHAPPNATYWSVLVVVPAMGASGGSHQAGIVPDPGSAAGATRFLCEDATFKAIATVPSLSEKRWAYFGIGSSTFSVIGDMVSIAGTGSNVCSNATTPNFVGCILLTSGATTGNGSRLSGILFWAVGNNIALKSYTAHDTTAVRFWLGMLSVSSSVDVDSLGTIKGAAFRFSTVAGDTHYQCVCSDGTSQTVVDSGVAPGADTFHRFEIDFNDSIPNVVFKIDDVTVATITTHLPAANTLLGLFCELYTEANVAKKLYIQSAGISADA